MRGELVGWLFGVLFGLGVDCLCLYGGFWLFWLGDLLVLWILVGFGVAMFWI